MAPLDFRDVKLYVDGERVQQLFVVSLAAERFWWLAFHERRGMNALDWSDVQSVEVRSVLRIDGSGQNARRRKFARVRWPSRVRIPIWRIVLPEQCAS